MSSPDELHNAISNHRPFSDIMTILHKNPDSVRHTMDGYILPIHMAVMYSASIEVIRMLILRYPEGVRIPCVGYLALHEALRNNLPFDTISLLLSSYPESAQSLTDNGETPLHFAALYCDDHRTLSLILSLYPDAVSKADVQGTLPLHNTAFNPNIPIISVAYLIHVYSEAVVHQDSDGNTPLHLMAQIGIRDIALLLIQANPDCMLMKNNKGRTPNIDYIPSAQIISIVQRVGLERQSKGEPPFGASF